MCARLYEIAPPLSGTCTDLRLRRGRRASSGCTGGVACKRAKFLRGQEGWMTVTLAPEFMQLAARGPAHCGMAHEHAGGAHEALS